jgi:hypothetical protein
MPGYKVSKKNVGTPSSFAKRPLSEIKANTEALPQFSLKVTLGCADRLVGSR